MKKITVKHYLNTRLKFEQEGNEKYYPIYVSVTYDRMNVRIPSNINYGNNYSISESDFLNNNIDDKLLFKMNYESDLIRRCVEMFQTDENLKQLNTDYYLHFSLKKYRSKNERLNILNSYIDYYSYSIYPVVHKFLKKKLEDTILPKINENLQEFDLLDSFKLKVLFHQNNYDLFMLIKKLELGYEYEMYWILMSEFYNFLADEGLKQNYDMPYIDWLQKIGQKRFRKFLKAKPRKIREWSPEISKDKNIDFFIETIENIIFNKNYFEKSKLI